MDEEEQTLLLAKDAPAFDSPLQFPKSYYEESQSDYRSSSSLVTLELSCSESNRNKCASPSLVVFFLQAASFLALLAFMILLLLKMDTTSPISHSWSIVLAPLLFFVVSTTALLLYLLLTDDDLDDLVTFVLGVTVIVLSICLAIQVILLGMYLEGGKDLGINLTLSPSFVSVFALMMFFIFALPGFLEPSSGVSKRVPFTMICYIVAAYAFLVLLSIKVQSG